MQNTKEIELVVMLLEKWAIWSHKDCGHGLGMKASSMNLWCSASANVPKPSAISLLPYGVDENEVFGKIDRAVCELPKVLRMVVIENYFYCHKPLWDRFRDLGICKNAYYKYLKSAHELLIPTVVKINL